MGLLGGSFGFNLTDQTREDQFLKVIDPNNSKEDVPFGRRIPGLVTTLGFSAARPELWLMEGPTWSIGQNVSKHVGKHSFKFGGKYLHHCCMRIKNAGPEFRYTSKDDLLNNVVSQVDVTFGPAPFRARMYEFGFFSQDDWRVKPNLVLNLGLRYDFFSNMVAHGKDGQDAAFYNPDGLLDEVHAVGVLQMRVEDGEDLGAAKQDAETLGIRWPMYVDDFRKIISAQLSARSLPTPCSRPPSSETAASS